MAVLLCEKVIVDRDTGQPSVIGVLSRFVFTDFPGELPQFFIFLQLVDGVGIYEIVIENRGS